jgi:antitoxin (DNA-binding transcriptional repressor) of toxin-antitoxin stability system
MSRSITATQLRVELRDLLSTIEDGPIEITKHGKVVAVLAAPSEARDPATHCTSHDEAPELPYPENNVGSWLSSPPDLTWEKASPDQREWYGFTSDEPQEAAGEPAEASEGTDTSEPDSASQSATEAEETLRKVAEWSAKNNVVIKDPDFQAEINSFNDSDEEEESDDPLAGLDDEFEAFLSSGAVMDRPSYHPEDEVFLR